MCFLHASYPLPCLLSVHLKASVFVQSIFMSCSPVCQRGNYLWYEHRGGLKYVWFGMHFKFTKFMSLCKTDYHGTKKKKKDENERK